MDYAQSIPSTLRQSEAVNRKVVKVVKVMNKFGLDFRLFVRLVKLNFAGVCSKTIL